MNEMILRGRTLSFHRTPEDTKDEDAFVYFEDGALHIVDGKITASGAFDEIHAKAGDVVVRDHRPDLLMPGFVDTHIHLPQAQMIGAYASSLLEWLHEHTFVEEQKFSDVSHCAHLTGNFLDELINQGTTTAAVYGSVHPQSVEALFAESERRGMLMVGGKVMMDRNAPKPLLDTAQRGYDDTKRLINDWHGRGRLYYAITPRFAITSSPEQLSMTRSLVEEHPDCYLQTHLGESPEEIEQVRRLFPDTRDYTHVYERYGLLGKRSLFGHCLHLGDRELDALSESASIAVFCPTSNLFLGSGLFNWGKTAQHGVRISTATDVAGGTSFSMLRTMDAAYKVMQLQGQRMNPLQSFYQITLGNARALGLQEKIGTLDPGSDADIVVLTRNASASLRMRMKTVSSLVEELMAFQTEGDDRTIAAVYINGTRH